MYRDPEEEVQGCSRRSIAIELHRGDGSGRIANGLSKPAVLWISILPRVPVHHVRETSHLFRWTDQARGPMIGNLLSKPARCGDEKWCGFDHLDRNREVRHGDRASPSLVDYLQREVGKRLPAMQNVHSDVVLGQVVRERRSGSGEPGTLLCCEGRHGCSRGGLCQRADAMGH